MHQTVLPSHHVIGEVLLFTLFCSLLLWSFQVTIGSRNTHGQSGRPSNWLFFPPPHFPYQKLICPTSPEGDISAPAVVPHGRCSPNPTSCTTSPIRHLQMKTSSNTDVPLVVLERPSSKEAGAFSLTLIWVRYWLSPWDEERHQLPPNPLCAPWWQRHIWFPTL